MPAHRARFKNQLLYPIALGIIVVLISIYSCSGGFNKSDERVDNLIVSFPNPIQIKTLQFDSIGNKFKLSILNNSKIENGYVLDVWYGSRSVSFMREYTLKSGLNDFTIYVYQSMDNVWPPAKEMILSPAFLETGKLRFNLYNLNHRYLNYKLDSFPQTDRWIPQPLDEVFFDFKTNQADHDAFEGLHDTLYVPQSKLTEWIDVE